ncbi:MAG TPA: FHA domain-containing protein [Cyanobacteria bacterium UBA8803]|nr:FHA domain-containing protein [Cyanobacteria bacterium UBA9273]HBL62629.1 FHA domain-containing protein [Cyanobacteria bacterium UBA8803]
MSTYLCPKGHQSTEPDYCSECGTRIQGSSEQLLNSPELSSTKPKFTEQLNCPDCSAPHELDSGDFCEICGYNFVSGAHGEMPILASSPVIPNSIKPEETQRPSHAQEIISISPAPSSLSWQITVTIDAVAHDPESPPPPNNFTSFSLPIERSTNLIGRTSQARAIYPEISLDFDDAISHRHALLNVNPDGNLMLRDIGSANGTKLNNVELKPMIDAPLRNGDEITLGHWTRIKVAGY